jgi:hypothetical protein
LRHFVKQPVFAPDPLDVSEDLSINRSLCPLFDPVDEVDQKLNEGVSDLLLSLRTVGRKKCVADVPWVAADLGQILNPNPCPVPGDNFAGRPGE